MHIDNRIALVTGAGSGLGLGTALELAAAGARVAAMDLPGRAQAALSQASGEFLFLDGDVSSEDDVAAVFSQITTQWGPPTILVNCAGILAPARVFRRARDTGRVSARDLPSLRRVIDINLTGTFNTVRLFAEGLVTAQATDETRGVIVNTSSVAAYDGLSGQAAYAAAKAGVAAMTLPLARELGPLGIRVVALAPGTFDTSMIGGMPEATLNTLIQDVAFPPRAGRPTEFSHMVLALIENDMMNGAVIRIDAGLRMREPDTNSKKGRP